MQVSQHKSIILFLTHKFYEVKILGWIAVRNSNVRFLSEMHIEPSGWSTWINKVRKKKEWTLKVCEHLRVFQVRMHNMSVNRVEFFASLPAQIFCFQNISKGFNGISGNLPQKVKDFTSVRFRSNTVQLCTILKSNL
jgi:hypothetical protein